MKIYDSKGREIPATRLERAPHPLAGAMPSYEEVLSGTSTPWAHCELHREWVTPETHEVLWVEYVGPDGGLSRYWVCWPLGWQEEYRAKREAREAYAASPAGLAEAAVKAADSAAADADAAARGDATDLLTQLWPLSEEEIHSLPDRHWRGWSAADRSQPPMSIVTGYRTVDAGHSYYDYPIGLEVDPRGLGVEALAALRTISTVRQGKVTQ